MTLEERKQEIREAGARQLHDLVCYYIRDSFGKPEVEKRRLYFEHRSKWFTIVDKNNTKKGVMVVFDRGAFSRLVDSKYVEHTKFFYPKTSWFKLWLLKFKQHSYA